MTLIDTVPGLRRGAAGARGGARRRVPGRGDDLEARAAARPDAGAATCPPTQVGPAGDRFRALYPDHAVAPTCPSCPARTRRSPPSAATGGRIVVVTGKYARQRPAAPRPPRRSTSTCSRAGSGAWARPRCSGARASSVYVGDHVHDVEGARAAGVAERQRADRRLHPRGARARRHRRRARRASPSSRPGSTSTCCRPGSTALEARPAGARRACVVAFSGGADTAFLLAAAVRALGPDHVVAATGYCHSLPAGRARPGPRLRRGARRRAAHARDPRDGARGLPRQRRRPLLLLQGRAARRAPPLAAARGLGDRRHRHQRRRRGRRLPAGDPGRRRARRGRPAARRRAHQGAGPRGLAPAGGCRPGTSPRPPACPPGWPTASRSPRTGWPASSAPRRRSATCSRPTAWPTCGSATSATAPRSRSTADLLPLG